MDIYTLAFMVLAIVLFIRLRSVLGRRTGSERPPFDPYTRRPDNRDNSRDKVVDLPRPTPIPGAPRDGIAREVGALPGMARGTGVAAIAAAEGSFDVDSFVGGAKRAYEMVVTAFAEGDRKTLRQLLSREVYDGFVAAIGEREQRGETVEFKFVGINKAEVTDASVRNRTAQITVRFVSSLISVTHGRDGKIIDGDPKTVSEVTDIWTFAKEVRASDPNWRLVATESVD